MIESTESLDTVALEDLKEVQDSVRTGLLGTLVQQRNRLGLTQSDVAQRAGLSRMSVQRAEAPDADVQLSTYVAMSLALRLLPQVKTTQPVSLPQERLEQWPQTVERVKQVLSKDATLDAQAQKTVEALLQVPLSVDAPDSPDPLIHRGVSHARTKQPHNKLEAEFAKNWESANRQGGPWTPVVEHLLPGCTQEQATAMATVVQWMGSEVGFDFLRQVLSQHGLQVVPKR